MSRFFIYWSLHLWHIFEPTDLDIGSVFSHSLAVMLVELLPIHWPNGHHIGDVFTDQLAILFKCRPTYSLTVIILGCASTDPPSHSPTQHDVGVFCPITIMLLMSVVSDVSTVESALLVVWLSTDTLTNMLVVYLLDHLSACFFSVCVLIDQNVRILTKFPLTSFCWLTKCWWHCPSIVCWHVCQTQSICWSVCWPLVNMVVVGLLT